MSTTIARGVLKPSTETLSSSLASHARAMIHQAESQTPSLACKDHSCRVSRCGCVAASASMALNASPGQRMSDAISPKKLHSASTAQNGKGSRASIKGPVVPVSRPHDGSACRLSRSPTSPRGNPLGLPSPMTRRSAPALVEYNILEECSPCGEDTREEEDIYEMPVPDVAAPLPPSPTHVELTESVLRKSQDLLKQMSELNLEPRQRKLSTLEEDDVESQSRHSQESACMALESKQLDPLETVEVPSILLQIIADAWEDMRESKKSRSTAEAARPPRKSKDDMCHISSMTSLLSAASTGLPRCVTPESWSDTATESTTSSPRLTLQQLPCRCAPTPRVVPARTLSPRGSLTQRSYCAATSLASIPQRGRSFCLPPPAATPAPQMVNARAGLLSRGAVNVTVTTTQTIKRTQSMCLLTY